MILPKIHRCHSGLFPGAIRSRSCLGWPISSYYTGYICSILTPNHPEVSYFKNKRFSRLNKYIASY